MKKYILTFDICSSTRMIDNLFQWEKTDKYVSLVDGYYAYLHSKKEELKFDIYKFLGDGFILIFEDREYIDDLLDFTIKLTFFSNQILLWFRMTHLINIELQRIGITSGLSYGSIEKISTINFEQHEFIGRPINIACRLQSALPKPSHTNCLLLLPDSYQKISSPILKNGCKPTTRVLKGIFSESDVPCYMFNPLFFLDNDWKAMEKIRNYSKAQIKKFAEPWQLYYEYLQDKKNIIEKEMGKYRNEIPDE